MSNRFLQIIVFAFSLLVAVYFGFLQPKDDALRSREIFQKRKIPVDQTIPKPAASVTRNPSSVLPADPPIGSPRAPLSLSQIADKYGTSYEYTKDQEGIVTRIRKSGDNVHGVRRFSTNRYSDLVARADEVIQDMRGLLGLDPELPTRATAVMTGETTGQVTYTQTLDGSPVEPWGKIAILLNRDGSIESVQSNALKRAKVMNTRRLDPKPASRKVAWVEQMEPVPQIRFGDETRERGIQRIYDAENGDLLFERDQKKRYALKQKQSTIRRFQNRF